MVKISYVKLGQLKPIFELANRWLLSQIFYLLIWLFLKNGHRDHRIMAPILQSLLKSLCICLYFLMPTNDTFNNFFTRETNFFQKNIHHNYRNETSILRSQFNWVLTTLYFWHANSWTFLKTIIPFKMIIFPK